MKNLIEVLSKTYIALDKFVYYIPKMESMYLLYD